MKKTYILYTIVFAVIVLLAGSEIRAQAPAVSPQRTCIAGSYGTAVAGPCLNGMQCNEQGLAAEFPRVVNCPQECNQAKYFGTEILLSGQFLRWDIEFRPPLGKLSPSLVGVQVAVDVQIEGAVGGGNQGFYFEPCVGSSDLKVGQNDCDSRWLKFSSNSSSNQPFLTSYFTQKGLGVLPEGVVVRSGNNLATCLLAGAGSPSRLDPNQAVADLQTFTLPGTDCYVEYNVAPNGKVIYGSLVVSGAGCEKSENTTITIDNKPTVFIGAVQYTQPGTCRYCWTNTAGGPSCCTCTTCCVSKATNKCVQKSTLTDPASQCTAASLP